MRSGLHPNPSGFTRLLLGAFLLYFVAAQVCVPAPPTPAPGPAVAFAQACPAEGLPGTGSGAPCFACGCCAWFVPSGPADGAAPPHQAGVARPAPPARSGPVWDVPPPIPITA